MTGNTKVVTGEVRCSYVHLLEPHAINPGDDAKYSVMLMVSKKDKATIEKLRAAEKVAAENGKSSKFGGKIPSNLASIIRDGDETAEDYPERAGHWILSVSSTRKPGVVDSKLDPIMDATEIYSGMYARASLNAFPYTYGAKKGVSFGLSHVMKTRDGDPLGGFTRAEDDFAEFADSDLV